MRPPRLHIVSDDAVAAAPDFAARAAALLDAGGRDVALHLRAPALTTRALHELAAPLAVQALRTGARLQINDRVDVALAVRCGAHLGVRGMPLPAARRLLDNALLGFSAHTREEVRLAELEGADYVFLGTIFPSETHPARPPAGVELVRRTVPGAGLPVLAIGGITPERVSEVRAAGAYGVAVIRGIWRAGDPLAALRAYLDVLET
ncbi:MAG TPA: thiamine phosphate synthase [Longimicrobiales bacterium]|nr:thiamine phosphate synthase [Longimicrobiales bacterium]